MNARNQRSQTRAFSLMEVLVVVAVVAIMVAIFLAKQARDQGIAGRIVCINNQKQISTALRLFAGDAPYHPFSELSGHTNMLPGIEPFDQRNPKDLWKLFQVLDDLKSPRVLYCPSDPGRSPASDFNTNSVPAGLAYPSNRLNSVSYFLSLDAEEGSPQLILMGDRYLTTDRESSSEKRTKFLFGQQDISSGSSLEKQVRWISTVHQGGGNATFMDGSVRQLTTSKLREAIDDQPRDLKNRIWLPNTDVTGRGNP